MNNYANMQTQISILLIVGIHISWHHFPANEKNKMPYESCLLKYGLYWTLKLNLLP